MFLKFWILYPAIAGCFIGIGHFAAFYLSRVLLNQVWFRNALNKYLMIDNEYKI